MNIHQKRQNGVLGVRNEIRETPASVFKTLTTITLAANIGLPPTAEDILIKTRITFSI